MIYFFGMKPLAKVKCEWSPKLAYVIGLIATDGYISIDGRHVSFTSKDLELAELYRDYLGLDNKIGKKARGGELEKKYFVVQFGDVLFYRFLLGIGLTPKKSKTINALKIPEKYFFDFFRGCIDGDGSIGWFFHPESKLPQFRVRLASASKNFLKWIQSRMLRYGIKPYICKSRDIFQLSFAKEASTKLLKLVYYRGFPASLGRKYEKAKKIMRV